MQAFLGRGLLLVLMIVSVVANAAPSDKGGATPIIPTSSAPLTLDRLSADTFRYFWETTDKNTGLAPDRYPSDSPASIAAVGFALTAYPIGVENGYITRQQAAERTLNTLRFFWKLPMGPEKAGTAGHQGFYYHFLNMNDGLRSQRWMIELSTVDTALLLGGVLFAQSYYNGNGKAEVEIRDLADKIYRRVNWQWFQHRSPTISLGWYPEKGFIDHDWVGYNEAMLVYILALGSPTFPVKPDAWQAWTAHYKDDWGFDNGIEYLTFYSMFGHQYSHVWIDFRDIKDDFMKSKNSDYFLNSKKAVYAQRQYAITNAAGWEGYDANQWGLTASDGPGKFNQVVNGKTRKFLGYYARGVGINYAFDDGTLAPTALGGSLPFAPEIVLPALQTTYQKYGKYMYTENYGFLDSYNPTFKFAVTTKTGKVVPEVGWFSKDHIGIDQGPILAMIENYRTGFVWNVMQNNPYIKLGLARAGFTGGWLDNQKKLARNPKPKAKTKKASAIKSKTISSGEGTPTITVPEIVPVPEATPAPVPEAAATPVPEVAPTPEETKVPPTPTEVFPPSSAEPEAGSETSPTPAVTPAPSPTPVPEATPAPAATPAQ